MKIKTIYGTKDFDSLFKPKIKGTPIRLLSLLNVNNHIHTKKSIFQLKSNSQKILKNKLFLSFQEKAQDTSNDVSKSNISITNYFNNKYGKISYSKNINFLNRLKRKLNQVSINSYNEDNTTKKSLAIVKNGVIYWLRKIYIIFQNKSDYNLRNKILNLYFYYPIKDLNIAKSKYFLYNLFHQKISDKFFCNNLEEISLLIKDFLKNKKIPIGSKINFCDEDFNIIKSSYQLMEKNEKYKLLYARIATIPEESIDKLKHLCNLKEINLTIDDSKKENNINLLSNNFNNKFNRNKPSQIDNNINKKKKNIKSNFLEIGKTLNELILNDIDLIPSFKDFNENKHFNNLLSYQSNYKNFMSSYRNNTMNNNKNIKLTKNIDFYNI